MLSEYISRAMRHAHYELMENGRFFRSIPECKGCWAEGATLEECREELQSTLEDWLLLGLQMGHPLPVIDDIDLNRKEIKRTELIHRLRALGWEGPFQKGKHPSLASDPESREIIRTR
jgi:predicted RNase H-like HicB family nuclease